MLIVAAVLAGLIVLAVALAAVGGAVTRTAAQPPFAVLHVDEAIDWIADRLPFEVAANLSHADVGQILGWHLNYFNTIGLASPHGEDLAGEVVPADHDEVVADDEAAGEFVIQRADDTSSDVSALDVVCVLDLHLQFLKEIGAVGTEADPPLS